VGGVMFFTICATLFVTYGFVIRTALKQARAIQTATRTHGKQHHRQQNVDDEQHSSSHFEQQEQQDDDDDERDEQHSSSHFEQHKQQDDDDDEQQNDDDEQHSSSHFEQQEQQKQWQYDYQAENQCKSSHYQQQQKQHEHWLQYSGEVEQKNDIYHDEQKQHQLQHGKEEIPQQYNAHSQSQCQQQKRSGELSDHGERMLTTDMNGSHDNRGEPDHGDFGEFEIAIVPDTCSRKCQQQLNVFNDLNVQNQNNQLQQGKSHHQDICTYQKDNNYQQDNTHQEDNSLQQDNSRQQLTKHLKASSQSMEISEQRPWQFTQKYNGHKTQDHNGKGNRSEDGQNKCAEARNGQSKPAETRQSNAKGSYNKHQLSRQCTTVTTFSTLTSHTSHSIQSLLDEGASLQSSTTAHASHEARQSLKIAKKMAGVFVCLFVCWTPFIVVGLYGPERVGQEGVVTVAFLVAFNSASNFAVYALGDREFRTAIGHVLWGWRPRRSESFIFGRLLGARDRRKAARARAQGRLERCRLASSDTRLTETTILTTGGAVA
jgi:hypothetical protein